MSWLISFIIVCKFWLNHHHLLGLARHADYGLVWLNAIFLMGQSFIPFPTALVGEYHGNALAVSFFGCVFALKPVVLSHRRLRRMGLHPGGLRHLRAHAVALHHAAARPQEGAERKPDQER